MQQVGVAVEGDITTASHANEAARYIVGVDTGGTFTDVVAIDGQGRVTFEKAFSTPSSPAQGVLAAIDNVAARLDLDRATFLARTDRFAHGTTVSTNALIQRAGACVGLLTTHGFEDTLVIGRGPMGRTGGLSHDRAMDFIHADPPVPLVPRTHVRGLSERVTRDGEIVVPLHEEDVARQIRGLLDLGAESLAVCLLWSFRNDHHEQMVRQVARRLAPNLPVSLSCEISPVLGELERAMTTVVNAYIGPITSRYIDRLSADLRAEGLRPPVQIMKASGGSTLPDYVAAEAVSIINSGPVGGVVAARHLAEQIGVDNLITTDMGGTSFDVGIIYRGEHEIERGGYLDQGIPVQVPAARIVAIGAGGGSIAWTDGRRLRVGPQSAGAQPGPACYGAGGTKPTVTDALVVLGILDPTFFFGGRRTLHPDMAEEAIRTHVAEPLGLSVLDAASGIYEIVNATMGDLVRKVTVESGFDPRRFSLVSYGGSGPAHCGFFAPTLGIREVVIPLASPVFSALGVAQADVLFSHARSEPLVVTPKQSTVDTCNAVLAELDERALADVEAIGKTRADAHLVRRLDLRYLGQMNEVTLTWGRVPLALDDLRALRQAFDDMYEGRFGPGTVRAESPLEIITFRVDALVPSPRPASQPESETAGDPPRPRTSRPVHVRGKGQVDTPVHAFEHLLPGHELCGPCIVERTDTTIYVPDGQVARMDGFRNLRLTRVTGGQQP